MLLMTLKISCLSADDSASIIGSDLTGPNVCKRIEQYNNSVIVSEMIPYTETRTVWCGKFSTIIFLSKGRFNQNKWDNIMIVYITYSIIIIAIAQIPPRCQKKEVKYKKANKTEIIPKMRAVYECCEGYIENDHRNGCIASCSQPCTHGVCISPNVCKCEEGFGGPSCDVCKFLLRDYYYCMLSAMVILLTTTHSHPH